MFDRFDTDRSGSLSLDEVTNLLNSEELRTAIQTLANVSVPSRTTEEIAPYFAKADVDKSGALSRSEFLALYLALAKDRLKHSPLVLAEALLGFIDVDRNGKIEGGELKVLLTLLGFPAALLLPIPGFVSVDYRGILQKLGGGVGAADKH